jgi:hypothetical protein
MRATCAMASSRTASTMTSASSSRSGGAAENAATPDEAEARRAASGRRAHRPSTGAPLWRSAPASAVATGPAPTMKTLGVRAVMVGTGLAD